MALLVVYISIFATKSLVWLQFVDVEMGLTFETGEIDHIENMCKIFRRTWLVGTIYYVN